MPFKKVLVAGWRVVVGAQGGSGRCSVWLCEEVEADEAEGAGAAYIYVRSSQFSICVKNIV